MDYKKIIQILLEKIEQLEQENELLHAQVDVIDVDISDPEVTQILNSIKTNRTL